MENALGTATKMNVRDDIWEIVLHYYENGDIKRIISQINISENHTINVSLKEDLEQDIIEILVKQNPDRIIQMHSDDKLGFYIGGIARRLVFGTKSAYYKEVIEYEKRKTNLDYRQ